MAIQMMIPFYRNKLTKIFLTGVLYGCLLPAWSDAGSSNDSSLIAFAQQAGAIGGAAQACGQPLDLFLSRSHEVIVALANNNTEVTNATGVLQSSLEQARANLAMNQQVLCSKVIADYNKLPLLQPDYATTVIAPLVSAKTPNKNAATGVTQPTFPNSSSNVMPAPLNASPAAPGLPLGAAPPLPSMAPAANPIFPGNTAPNQSYTASNNPALPPYPINNNTPANTDAAKIQLAQQLAQMAQNLLNSSNNSGNAANNTGNPPNPIFPGNANP